MKARWALVANNGSIVIVADWTEWGEKKERAEYLGFWASEGEQQQPNLAKQKYVSNDVISLF